MSGRQGIRDWQKAMDCGKLIDVSYQGYDVGMLHPTAITVEAWNRYVKVEERPAHWVVEREHLQVILSMLRLHMACGGMHGWPLSFHVPTGPKSICLDVVLTRCDDGIPLIIIDLPGAN
jgi:hypothetical protein